MDTTARNARTFPLIAFSDHTVAELTGLSIHQLRRWDRNGFFQPSLADPNRRRPYSRIYSRDDVVALRTIAKMREAGVSFAQLKQMLPFLEPDDTGERPVQCFHVVGRRVFLSRDEAVAAAREIGAQVELVTIDVASMIAELEGAIERLRERRPEQIGQVTRNRGIMGGVPIIAGTRIPTETIAWFHSHGYPLPQILENFPRLTAQDVAAAVDFESAREAKAPEPVLVRG